MHMGLHVEFGGDAVNHACGNQILMFTYFSDNKTQQNILNKTFSVVRREVGGSSQTLYVPSDCSRSLYSDSSETPLETMVFINSA